MARKIFKKKGIRKVLVGYKCPRCQKVKRKESFFHNNVVKKGTKPNDTSIYCKKCWNKVLTEHRFKKKHGVKVKYEDIPAYRIKLANEKRIEEGLKPIKNPLLKKKAKIPKRLRKTIPGRPPLYKNIYKKKIEKNITDYMDLAKKEFDKNKKIAEDYGVPFSQNSNAGMFPYRNNVKLLAKTLSDYIQTTKADPRLFNNSMSKIKVENALKSRKHMTKYGLAQAIGITVKQLDKILESDPDEAESYAIQGMIRGVLEMHNDYVANLMLDGVNTAEKYLSKFADKKGWESENIEGEIITLPTATMNNLLNQIVEKRAEPLQIDEPEDGIIEAELSPEDTE